MPSRRSIIIGSLLILGGVVAGSALTGSLMSTRRPRTAVAAAPNQSTSRFFKTFDPSSLVETISGRSFSGGQIRTDAFSVSGGGLRWGERRFVAFWESLGGGREEAGASLEKAIDKELADAGLTDPNAKAGVWLTHPSGAVL